MVAIVVTTLTLMLVCSCGMCIARNVKLAFVEMVNLAQNIDKNTKDVEGGTSYAAPGMEDFEMKKLLKAGNNKNVGKKRSRSLDLFDSEEVSSLTLTAAICFHQITKHQSSSLTHRYVLLDVQDTRYEELISSPSSAGTSPIVSLGADESPASSSSNHAAHRHVNCLYRTCFSFYILAMTFLLALGTTTFLLYPSMPVYNICSNEMDWKSIVDGMTSLKMQTNYQLLISVYNPNYFDAEVIQGEGTFEYDGVYVGTMTFGKKDLDDDSPTKIAANSITDVIITASFTPDKWEALQLTAEYYKGTLKFKIDSKTTVRIPFFDYTFTSEVKDLTIHIGDMNDRYLCACPVWS